MKNRLVKRHDDCFYVKRNLYLDQNSFIRKKRLIQGALNLKTYHSKTNNSTAKNNSLYEFLRYRYETLNLRQKSTSENPNRSKPILQTNIILLIF